MPDRLSHPPVTTHHRPHWPLWLGLAVLLLSLAAAVTSGLQSLMLSRALSESRTVAEMAENIGKWASQYGGVHVRTQGVDTRFPGNFLTRSVYGNDPAVAPGTERANLQQMESYYWKNPALIQREVADVIAASGSRARYRMTARTVINANNAPNAFEQLAMDALMGDENVGKKEFWQVSGNELRYARAVVPQKSCLRCHDSQDKAPDFLKTSTQFTGGGGFGYREGKTAGVISVLVPLPSLGQALLDSAGPEFWGMLALAGVSSLGLIGWALASSRAAHAHARAHAPGHPVAHPPAHPAAHPPAHSQAPVRPQAHARPPHPPHS